MFSSLHDLQTAISGNITIENEQLTIENAQALRETLIDQLIYTALFSPDQGAQATARQLIKKTANTCNIFSRSIRELYLSIGRGEVQKIFTVPAMNIRTLTYDTARILFRLAKEKQYGPFIFEISRGEMDYTHQRPEAYTCAVLAAAIKENYTGPVFLQGDHFQFSQKRYTEDPEGERGRLKTLIDESLAAQFYNIDIDASTLVDLSKENLDDQQKDNYTNTAILTKYIREKQPKDVIVSIGGEIGHIGDKNSTIGDLDAFMKGLLPMIDGLDGVSKISVQTGTSHGGTPTADGKIKDVQLDFNVLKDLGALAKEQYHLGGVVQHGASTLPNDMFHLFSENHTLEIHLATGFQNIVYDYLPQMLKQVMYAWIDGNMQKEKQEGWTEEQFIYKTRKKALGQFEQQLWEMTSTEKQPVLQALEKELLFLFEKLGIVNTRDILAMYDTAQHQ